MAAIDLNSDLGEWDLAEDEGNDAHMFATVTSANIACGFHAGSPKSMLASARLAAKHGVGIGAHPSYRDREGFGRRDQEVDPGTLRRDILEQVSALTDAANTTGTRVRYLKPHGALYNRIAVDPVQAETVALTAHETGLPILGLAGSAIHEAANRHGVQFFREAFLDRAYLPNGLLAPRSMEGAVITDVAEVSQRAVQVATEGSLNAIDGSILRIELDSLCVHGDTAGATMMAESVRSALLAAGVELRAFV